MPERFPAFLPIMGTDMPAWKEQLDRVERYLSRIQQHDRPRVDYEDDLWSFFQNCWHLKDWIKNDKTVNVSAEALERDASSFRSLRICADLANRSKHLKLTNKRLDAIIRGDIRVTICESLSGSQSNAAISYGWAVVSPDGSICSAMEVAREAVSDWNSLLRRYNLL